MRCSLRTRLLGWALLLIAVISASLFFLVDHALEHEIVSDIDSHLEEVVDEMEKTYALGYPFEEEGYRSDLSGVPTSVLDQAHLSVADFVITRWKLLEKDGFKVYELKGYSGQDLYEVEVNDQNQVVERERELSRNRYSLIEETFHRRLSTNHLFSMVVADSRGQERLVLGSVVKAKDRPKLKSRQPETEIFAGGHEVRILSRILNDGSELSLWSILEREKAFMTIYRNSFLMMLLPSLFLALGTAWWFTRDPLGEIESIGRALDHMGDGRHGFALSSSSFKTPEFLNVALRFNQMAQRVESTLKEMQNLTDQVAHDLRTPITRMKAQLEEAMTREGDLDSASLMEDCQVLETLISTMLEISALDAGLQEGSSEVLGLEFLVEKALDLFEPLASERGLMLKAEKHGGPFGVRGRERMIQRALSNLLDNAIKYSHKGEVVVSLWRCETKVVLEVRDQGLGIAPEDLERVCQRFFRSARHVNVPGHGLGLSYVQAVARLQGGALSIESVLNQGTTVRWSMMAI